MGLSSLCVQTQSPLSNKPLLTPQGNLATRQKTGGYARSRVVRGPHQHSPLLWGLLWCQLLPCRSQGQAYRQCQSRGGWNSTLLWKNKSFSSPSPTNSISAFGSPPRPGTKGGHPTLSTTFNFPSQPESQPRGSEAGEAKKSRYTCLGWSKTIWGIFLFLIVK